MKMRVRNSLLWLVALTLFEIVGASHHLAAAPRDAAFIDPNLTVKGLGGRGASGSDAIIVEPKADIDTGESVVGIARRITLFFSNQTTTPVEIVSVTVNNDGNVKSDLISDDCSKEGTIAAASRCSIIVEITPSSAGAWTAELLLTHKGAGRIARAKLSGKAVTQSATEKRESGFSLSTKEIKPIEFGTVEANIGRVVRTALMINDSPETIAILSIDVIAAENGLERLDQGCVLDMELKPGESCPVTLVWKPESKGLVSTDLIIRHSGKLGFAVIPLRGTAKELDEDKHAGGKTGKTKSHDDARNSGNGKIPLPSLSAAEEIEKVTSNAIPPLSSEMIAQTSASSGGRAVLESTAAARSDRFHLIGTVGNRAVLLKPDGTTVVADVGEEIVSADGRTAKLTNVMVKGAELFIDGKKTQLTLEAASELTSRAAQSAEKKSKISSNKSSTSSTSKLSTVSGGVSK